jgi:hypothetical protein
MLTEQPVILQVQKEAVSPLRIALMPKRNPLMGMRSLWPWIRFLTDMSNGSRTDEKP